MAKIHIKKGDSVMVIAGKDKGKSGEVLLVNPDTQKVLVDGLNIVSKSTKPRSAQETGGIIKKSAPFAASNVMPICPSCNQVTRVSISIEEVDGKKKKERVCKKCNASLDEVRAAKKKSAAKKATKADSKKTKSSKKAVAEDKK